MDFKDASSRFKKANKEQDAPGSQPKPMDFAESYRLRARMIGVLIRDARQSANRTAEDCAALLRVSLQQMEAWEFGESVPSLPQLELLANFLGVPISHFWGMETISDSRSHRPDANQEYLALRDRMIGALLRQAREESQLTLEQVSEASGIPVGQIERYELGETPLPIHELTVLANAVNRNVSYFLESSSYIGQLLATREAWKHFADLPDEVRQFAANPINIGFIEIAIMLSKMPTDQLRRVGESMLEITM
jgi:transcriptional regulator with XRE-family HTH domain